MQDTELFLALAEIAGVFVGFGALITVRSGATSEAFEVGYMRGVVSMGLLTVVAALAPVTLGRYGLAGHQVWALSSALVLVGWLGMVAAQARTPEYQANWTASLAALRWRWSDLVEGAAYVLYITVAVLAPIVVMLDLARDQEPALYFTAVVLILLGAAWTLLVLVFSQQRPASGH